MTKHHAVFDTEIIGKRWPVFLTCVTILETGERYPYWQHSDDDRRDMFELFLREDLTFVSFNGIHFDYPMVCAAMDGWHERDLKHLGSSIIERDLKQWQTMKEFNIPELPIDMIDLMEVAPGVMVSLKRYMARMGYKTMMDMPMHHDTDLTNAQLPTVVKYCFNDCGGTAALFNELREQIDLRIQMGKEYGIDLRSKSDAQVAEAILRKKLKLTGKQQRPIPQVVHYTPPDFIESTNPDIQALIERMANHTFTINQGNGSPEQPDWMEDDFKLGSGSYKVGIGGLHSTHDVKFYVEATDDLLLSDFDVASYYPSLILRCGYVPKLGGTKGQEFLTAYREIYEQRLAAKHRASELTKRIAEIERLLKDDK